MKFSEKLALRVVIAIVGVVWPGQALVGAQGGTSTGARDSSNTFANVMWFAPPASSGQTPGTPVAGASSVMIRNAEGVAFTLDTNSLTPGDAVTIWWVVFNRPQFCSAPGCGEDDLENARAMPSVFWATGGVVDRYGFAHFSAHQAIGGPAPGEVLFGPGLIRRNAEIHLVVHTHGHASSDPAVRHAQLTTFAGGCSDTNPCFDMQAAQHMP